MVVLTRTRNCDGHVIEAHFGPRIGYLAVSQKFATRAHALGVLALVPDHIKTAHDLRVYESLKK